MTALPITSIDVQGEAVHPGAPPLRLAATPVEFPWELAQRTARILARALWNPGQSPQYGKDDLRQEMLLAAWGRWPRFDPGTASASTFLSLVMRHAHATLMRGASARKRRPKQVKCANSLARPESDTEVGRIDPRLAGAEGRLDVQAVLATLRADLQATCALLMHATVADAARSQGVPRHEVVGQVHELRHAFAAAGFGPTRRRSPS